VLSNNRRRVAAVATAAAVTVGGGAAAVLALTSGASAGTPAVAAATTGPTHTATAKGHHHHKAKTLLQRTDHAAIELRQKGVYVTFDLDRGTVESVSSSAITLLRPDGQTVTEKIDGATHFRGVTSASGVHTGVKATVISEGGTARRVIQGMKKSEASASASASVALTS
jgi:branched-subunit amino acid aminotransferase/4-amino-4-deoxychorismate lyase